MPLHGPGRSGRSVHGWVVEAATIVLLASLGVGMAFSPTISSGFSRMQTDEGDSRLVNYILEHSYQWMLGQYPHRRLWDPPIFYPARGVEGYCENLLSVFPFYAPFRAMGLAPDTSFQMWMIVMVLLNFGAFYVLLRACLRLHPLASAIGSWVFAFGSARIAQLGHQQLVPSFYGIAAICLFCGLLRAMQDGRSRQVIWAWIFSVFLAMTLQFYAGVYVTFFFVVCLGLATVWAAVLPGSGAAVRLLVIRHHGAMLVSIGICVALSIPVIQSYLAASKLIGPRSWEEVSSLLPRPQSWVFMGDKNWLYKGMADLPQYRQLVAPRENAVGMGFVLPVLAIIGLVLNLRRAWAPVALLTVASVVALTTMFADGRTAWRFVYDWLPGANGIRCMSRIGMMFLIPAGIGLALLVHRVCNTMISGPARKAVVVAVLALSAFAMLEQGTTTTSYDKQMVRDRVHRVAALVDPACKAFYYTPLDPDERPKHVVLSHIDAMWAQNEVRKPTINAYSGGFPTSFCGIYFCGIRSRDDELRVGAALDAWVKTYCLDRAAICWIKPDPSEYPPSQSAPASGPGDGP